MKNNSYQQQLGRLINYAKGIGLNVFFRDYYKNGPAAEWTLDGKEIIIYVRKNQPKIQIIMCLIHELGHHLDYVRNKYSKYDHRLSNALDKTDKKSRAIVFQNEKNGMKFWKTIYEETNLTFPIRRLELEMRYDYLIYEYWYETGQDPTTKLLKKFKKMLRKEFGYNYEK